MDEGEDAKVAPGVLRRLDRACLAQVRQVVATLIIKAMRLSIYSTSVHRENGKLRVKAGTRKVNFPHPCFYPELRSILILIIERFY